MADIYTSIAAIQIDMQSHREAGELVASIPAVSATIGSGAFLNLALPTIFVSDAAGDTGPVGNISTGLPSIVASFGIATRLVSALPSITHSGVILHQPKSHISSILPKITMAATGTVGINAVLSSSLRAMRSSITGQMQPLGGIYSTLPRIGIEIQGIPGKVAYMDGTIPIMRSRMYAQPPTDGWMNFWLPSMTMRAESEDTCCVAGNLTHVRGKVR